MPHFYVQSVHDDNADSFWILAGSEHEARRLIALNVPDAATALDPGKYECAPDGTKTPPEGVIYRRLGGTVTVKTR